MNQSHVALWWLPVGAGGHFVVHTSRLWEAIRARREHRAAHQLFHAALEVFADRHRYVIEMTPAWGWHDKGRNVVATGPVLSPRLGRSRLFRYEVRCWDGGEIPDKAYAPVPPLLFSLGPEQAVSLVQRVAGVPRHVWGRDPGGTGDMWNSNSVVSWLLCAVDVDAAALVPPCDGSAPGWAAGVAIAGLGSPDSGI
ncbi:MAG TPA: hypothetical protein PKE40_11425 [Arachnia sp.]|nr:hypothetical protein [Arachnia sp.]HMT86954.1 hypothetical protein [Arachnia sp.]